MKSTDRLLRYWGKAGEAGQWHPLAYRQLDVSAVGLELLEALPTVRQKLCDLSGMDPANLKAWLGFFLAIHDLGKFASAFQQLKPELAPARTPSFPYRVRHDTLGHIAWRTVVEDEPRLMRSFRVAAHEDDLYELLDLWAKCVTPPYSPPYLLRHRQPPRPGRFARSRVLTVQASTPPARSVTKRPGHSTWRHLATEGW